MSEEDQLLRSAIAGDPDALAGFVRETELHVWRFCTYLGSGDDVADLVQETYARALRALPGFRGQSPARVWLIAIARRVCADAVRNAQRRRAIALLGLHHDDSPDAASGVELSLMLDGLTPERREAFVLTQLLGFPYADAAEACGVPIGTIRSRVARAREDLQAELRAETA